ncbi:glutamine--tRNA ligase [Ventosimonas gracilis]|uniref:Glutamine--tRNA ligase n=1 Tax=Ventosimonas gracilis TaxID=1680762 RepID=A0A139SR01_9GAMM|nr:glutamine--tRNA ligase/YqeY domain fusion protein [Ventosimonas gracilis]KXU36963.1 glutamine--tRNA ligase [Ventosimonas gracilis]
MSSPANEAPAAVNFLRKIVADDLASGKHSQIVTRFPPEPNGFLHIGHAKSICLNFGLAEEFGGQCHLRFDDTNPSKEEQAYIDSIEEDIKWLGFRWHGAVRYASNYFEVLYQWALHLIESGNAYVCDLSADEARAFRGSLTEPGKNSPYRERSVAENLDLFKRMKAGEFVEGSRTLRAKIDMASGNINLRDPVLYRIRFAHHHQTGDAWCIYPSYDFTHGQSDAIEGITHSICTLEFEDHRPLYEWFLQHLPVPCKPRQYEFARLNLSHCVTSKRKLARLVAEGYVDGWDDPRMPTLAGLRRRGYPPAAIRRFCERIGVNRAGGLVDFAMLELCVREELDSNAPRAMCVLKPLKVIISNYPADEMQTLQLPRHPKQDMGTRSIPFSRELYIDQDDFSENPPAGYKRLVLGGEVRLRGAYVIKADKVIKDESGQITALECRIDADTLGANPAGRKVKGVIHWVCAEHSILCAVRLYDRQFQVAQPEAEGDFLEGLTAEDMAAPLYTNCRAEPALLQAKTGEAYQFEREGYFCRDREDLKGKPLFNRTVTLRDTWGEGKH